MFRSQFFWRLYAAYVAIIVITTSIVGLWVSREVMANGIEEARHSLAVRSELLAEIARESLLDPGNTDQNGVLQRHVVELGMRTGSRLTIIAADGTVLADSEESPSNMDNHGKRPEIEQAAQKGSAISSRFSQTLGQETMYRALRVTESGRPIGFVRAALPLTTIDEKLAQLQIIVLIGAGVAALSALLMALYFAKRFADPFTRMTEVAEAISQGDYDKRIAVNHTDEIGKLAESFNRMAISSARRMAELTTDHNRIARIFTGIEMVEGVIGVDQEQQIIHINQSAADLLDLSMDTAINKPVRDEIVEKDIIAALEQTLDTQDVVKTQMRRASDNDDLVIDIYAAALLGDDGVSAGAVIVLHDISELDHLERIRRDFVANASHELKTPITAIQGLTETILDDANMEQKTLQRFVGKIHAQSLRLSTLVSDLMTISRLESDQDDTHFHPFELGEVVRKSVSATESACQEKQLTLGLSLPDDPVLVNGDVQAMSQMIDNLLDNARKYTPAGGIVSVRLTTGSATAILLVEDTGIGIEPQYQQRIFERFYRVDKARSRELGGTGLGLSIVKNIAEHHGGSVGVRSRPDSGSRFTVTIPVTG